MNFALAIFLAGFTGGFASAALARRGARLREREVLRILRAEWSYWQDCAEREPDPVTAEISIGAIGAISNVIAALSGHLAPWHRAPWHRKPPRKGQVQE